MNQKLEADKLKVVANNQGYQVKAKSRSMAKRPRWIIASRTTAMRTSAAGDAR